MEKKRLIAIKTNIVGLTSGKYIAEDGNSFIITKKAQRIGRVRILATVVDKYVSASKKLHSITLDDGTDTIRSKIFESLMLEKINTGDIVDVVGRIREYNGELYVQLENIIKIHDPNFEILRQLEIQEQNKIMDNKKRLVLEYKKQISDLLELKHVMKEFGISSEDVETIIESESISEPDEEIGTDEQKEKILSSIEQMDKGDGCTYSELMEASGLSENILDVVVEELLNEGACYEPKPGKIRKL